MEKTFYNKMFNFDGKFWMLLIFVIPIFMYLKYHYPGLYLVSFKN